ncbi:S24 family peptidase [Vibrio sp. Makdt]|uniref:LexA family protein n=1 Tax=Vibrio sp. Makdt TaxID=2998828 RepID=UPI0022CDA172|nr:S24 family peptidase [Vibrio sp. Makdt]MDA0152166.1 S24 family peptidase [Vibrio sp. Makdt]
MTESTRFEILPQEYRKLNSKIDDMLIHNPSSTWLGIANGESMINVGIFDGDLLIIDRNEKATQNDVVVCNLNGEFTVKLLDIQNKSLVSANPRMKPVPISELDILSLEGVVISSIRQHRSLTQMAVAR